MFLIFAVVCAALGARSEESVGTARDSYVDAFKATHGLNKHKGDIKREYSSGNNDFPHPVYKPQEDYGPPQGSYGPPKDFYGPPKDAYGPPKDAYGPPKDVYGPPKDQYGPPIYGPTHNFQEHPTIVLSPGHVIHGPPIEIHDNYHTPHAFLGLLDKFKFKLDLFTLGKIILKLVIFKKIVSLIAILCLLLFIPSLKHKKNKHTNYEDEEEEDEDEMRSFKRISVDQKLNNIAAYVTGSIEKFDKKYNGTEGNCDSFYCKKERVISYLNNTLSFKKLFNLYLNDK